MAISQVYVYFQSPFERIMVAEELSVKMTIQSRDASKIVKDTLVVVANSLREVAAFFKRYAVVLSLGA